MLILAVDTSSPSGSIAILEDQKVLGVNSTSTTEDYSSRFFRHLEWLLQELSLNLSRFDAFAVGAGPGSFTGLRVGLAAVKGWAEACNRPVLSVNVLQAIAFECRSSTTLLAPVFDARRNEVYFGFYAQRSETMPFLVPEVEGESQVSSPDDFLKKIQAKAHEQEVTVVTPTPELIAERLKAVNENRAASSHVSLEVVPNVLAPVIGLLGWHRTQLGRFESALSLDANYVRRTDAELKWKAPATKSQGS